MKDHLKQDQWRKPRSSHFFATAALPGKYE